MLEVPEPALNDDAQPEVASSPGYRGSFNSSTRVVAQDLAARAEAERETNLVRSLRFAKAAARLSRCADASAGRTGWRCGLPICPRCEYRKAVRYRERMEAQLRVPGRTFKLLTATVAADDLQHGLRVLRAAFTDLKRRTVWKRAVAGGEAHLQFKPSRPGASAAFNVHFHAIVELRSDARLDAEALASTWVLLLARRGAVGHLHVCGVERHWAVYRDP